MRTIHGVSHWQVIYELDILNHARCRYGQPSDEEEKQQADVFFAQCYDWLTMQDVPISYDPGP